MHFPSCFCVIALLLNVEVLGKTLVPIRPNGGKQNQRRSPAELDLRNAETFLWGEEDGSQLASFTVDMPGDTENILSMEHFDGMLTSVSCGNDSISMTFDDDDSFAYAQRTWDWVNGADNHSFVMVAGAGNCGNNTDRIPFVISTMSFDEHSKTARLNSTRGRWEDLAHSYDLVVGSVAQDPAKQTLNQRDIDKSSSIDFKHDLPFSVSLSSGRLSATLSCTKCSTTGQFDMQFNISQKLLIPTGASMKLSPRGVSAIAQIRLGGSGDLIAPLTKSFDILSIPINALNIPGILDLGPFLAVAVGASLAPLSLSGGITSRAKAKLSDSAVLEMDLLNPDKNTFSGWTPDVEVIGVSADASLSTTFSVFLQPSVEIRAEALGKGFEIGLNMKIPNVNARLSAIASSSGACGNKTTKTNRGVKIATNIGAQLSVQALQKAVSEKPLFTVTLATLEKPLAEVCFPLGSPLAKRQMGHPHDTRRSLY